MEIFKFKGFYQRNKKRIRVEITALSAETLFKVMENGEKRAHCAMRSYLPGPEYMNKKKEILKSALILEALQKQMHHHGASCSIIEIRAI